MRRGSVELLQWSQKHLEQLLLMSLCNIDSVLSKLLIECGVVVVGYYHSAADEIKTTAIMYMCVAVDRISDIKFPEHNCM